VTAIRGTVVMDITMRPIHVLDNVIHQMVKSISRLSPLFRSDAQGEILARVFLDGGARYSTSDLARLTNVPYATAHREVQRLVETNLVMTEHVGRSVLVRANPDDPAFLPLVELLQLSFGPTVVLGRLLSGVPDLEEAYVYGSWAARRLGEGGSPPGDIDVLVVGRPDRSLLFDTADAASKELHRDVSIRATSRETWERADDPFLKTVRQRPLVPITMGGK